jgi:hypothetical protein
MGKKKEHVGRVLAKQELGTVTKFATSFNSWHFPVRKKKF